MFDISFTELMLIGIVALVVIGPERLPRVARTVGHLVGRAQRYVGDVKSDIQREMELDQVKDLKSQMEEAAKSVQTSVKDAANTFRDPLEDARKAIKETSDSVESAVNQTRDEINSLSATATRTDSTDIPPEEPSDDTAVTDPVQAAVDESIAANNPDDTARAVSGAPQSPPRPLSDTELADLRLRRSGSDTSLADRSDDATTEQQKSGTPL